MRSLGPCISFRGSETDRVEYQERLDSIFRLALRINAQGMIGNMSLEHVWSACASIFESGIMTMEQSKEVDGEIEQHEQKAQMVLLTLVPGFRLYSCKRDLVDYCSFVTGYQDAEKELMDLRKATVITH